MCQPSEARAMLLYRFGLYEFYEGAYIIVHAHCVEALVTFEALKRHEDEESLNVLDLLGTLFVVMRRFAEAKDAMTRVLRQRESIFGADYPRILSTIQSLASLCNDQGRLDEATVLFEKALRISRTSFGPTHYKVSLSRLNLARVLDQQGRREEASHMLSIAQDDIQMIAASDDLNGLALQRQLGRIWNEQGRLEEAEHWIRDCIETIRGTWPRTSRNLFSP